MRGRSMSREHFPADDDENTVVEVKGSEMWVEVWLWKLGGLGKVDGSVSCVGARRFISLDVVVE